MVAEASPRISVGQLRAVHLARLPRHWQNQPHSHSYSEIVIPTSGRVETTVGGQTKSAGPGQVLIYPAGQVHQSRAGDGKPLTQIVIGWEGRSSLLPDEFTAIADAQGRLTVLGRWFLEVHPVTDDKQRELAQSLLTSLLFEIHQNLQSPVSNLSSMVRRYVKQHLAEPLSIADLSRAAGLSPFHFSRVFKEAEGIPPMTFVRNARLEVARTLLETTRLTLREVAESVGFSDQFQLSRIFRRVLGMAPSDVRASKPRK
ncbi:MAG: AraC family transcriptional regulator [Polyangiaceae bacterium]|nr:AraC family transcriptional regulator [Polyangiaceae bacterium]